MGRRGKLKYKDIVKKFSQPKVKKKPKQRKTYSVYKNDFKNNYNKRKYVSEEVPSKRVQLEEKKIEEAEHFSDSPSEEEDNALSHLLNTFSNQVNNKHSLAVESSSESENENETLDDGQQVNNVPETVEDEENGTNSDSDLSNKEDNIDIEMKDPEEDINKEDNDIESEIELETSKEDATEIENVDDPFNRHLLYNIHNSVLESLQSTPPLTTNHSEEWPVLGKVFIQIPKSKENIQDEITMLEKNTYASAGVVPKRISRSTQFEELFIKSQIIKNVKKVNKSITQSENLSLLQSEMFSVINNYQDFYYPSRTFDNAEEIRFVYCLHAVNHVLKTRLKVIHHNARLSKKDDVPDEFRDQGLVRPKVLIIVPFKDSAYKIVKMIIDLILPEDKGNVMNKIRFMEDYTGNELILPKRNPKPEDYEKIFQGNSSDDFKIGITITKKSLKLYAEFYSSDIIVASPLGLRTTIGAEGEPERDYDFLASIELLIFDQSELFLMQNWDHVLHIMNHMHLQPKDSHGTDFSRVRMWSLNGWAKYYRQTLIFSSITLPEINAIFNKKCLNYAGKVKVVNPVEIGCIGQIVVQVPHIFQRFHCHNAPESVDARFEFFINKVLPQQRDSMMKQTLIFIPSYFDFVRVRNYFKREDIGFVQICEYSKDSKIARARDIFFHGDAHFLLYTERFHFFHRKRIKGIRHILFYQLPIFPNFYYEMCNLMQEGNQNRKLGNNSNMSVTVIYSKYDVHQLSAIVGTEKTAKMLQSERRVHMMVTGGE